MRRWNDGAKMALIGLLTTLVAVLVITCGTLVWQDIQAQRGLSTARASLLQSADALRHARSAQRTAVSAHQLAQVINAERNATILRSCRDQNADHAATVKQLDEAVPRTHRTSRRITLLLIDKLAPYRDCQQVLKTSTSP